MRTLNGACHCGALTVRLETSLAAAELPVRFCGCSYCQKHGALWVADPGGRANIESARDAAATYHFGHRTADFVFCSRCGALIAAACKIDDQDLAVVNLNALEERLSADAQPPTADYEGESGSDRLARRAERWTPLRPIGWVIDEPVD
jgi:hypothetical protein